MTAASPPTAERSPTALTVRGLRKAFGPKVAVAGIDLDIPHGCLFGLVGPNGAGKTTTLGMVTGLLRPDAGLVVVDGVEVWRDPPAAKRRIGVLPEDLRLFERLTGAALLHAPRVLFLDEPFEAIDPVSARTIRGLLERYTAGGATVVFSSHVMELVERLCDRVGIMHLGRLIAEGPTERVRAGRSLEDAFVELVGAGGTAPEELGWLGTSSA